MKTLDEIMALDRAGTPVTYRDLLPVVDAVADLEDSLARTSCADTNKSRYILQLREEVKALTAQRNASLDPIVRARMMAPAPALVVHLPTLEQLARAFEAWETACRADVDANFLTAEECAQLGVSELSANRAAHFLALLAEVLP